ncbi:hypothetical protein DENSPDRAFT_879743 [Dentipellis sp. KUC8613]|nr:hypothetical protein DENSPDRAFT_879743 [Dentipellis sp. KUC8613]
MGSQWRPRDGTRGADRLQQQRAPPTLLLSALSVVAAALVTVPAALLHHATFRGIGESKTPSLTLPTPDLETRDSRLSPVVATSTSTPPHALATYIQASKKTTNANARDRASARTVVRMPTLSPSPSRTPSSSPSSPSLSPHNRAPSPYIGGYMAAQAVASTLVPSCPRLRRRRRSCPGCMCTLSLCPPSHAPSCALRAIACHLVRPTHRRPSRVGCTGPRALLCALPGPLGCQPMQPRVPLRCPRVSPCAVPRVRCCAPPESLARRLVRPTRRLPVRPMQRGPVRPTCRAPARPPRARRAVARHLAPPQLQPAHPVRCSRYPPHPVCRPGRAVCAVPSAVCVISRAAPAPSRVRPAHPVRPFSCTVSPRRFVRHASHRWRAPLIPPLVHPMRRPVRPPARSRTRRRARSFTRGPRAASCVPVAACHAPRIVVRCPSRAPCTTPPAAPLAAPHAPSRVPFCATPHVPYAVFRLYLLVIS